MTIIKVLEEVRTWLQNEVCENFTFKKEPAKEEAIDSSYDFELVKPKAFLMYVPFEEKFPSVTIQFSDGNLNKFKESGELKLRFLFATWNPGLHDKDKFEINAEGWRDVWNFVDGTLRKLTNTNHIGDYIRIKHEDGFQFGAMSEDGNIPNFYPHWGAWLTFTIKYGETSSNEDIHNLI